MNPDDHIRQQDAQLRYYFGIDPDTLTDEERAIEWNNLLWVRSEEKRLTELK